MHRFGAPEQPPEEYEQEFSDVEDLENKVNEILHEYDDNPEAYIPYEFAGTAEEADDDIWTDDDNYPKGSVVPINPEITDHEGQFGGTWERCKVCGSTEFLRFDGHWVCAYDYVEYETNIQF